MPSAWTGNGVLLGSERSRAVIVAWGYMFYVIERQATFLFLLLHCLTVALVSHNFSDSINGHYTQMQDICWVVCTTPLFVNLWVVCTSARCDSAAKKCCHQHVWLAALFYLLNLLKISVAYLILRFVPHIFVIAMFGWLDSNSCTGQPDGYYGQVWW